MDAPVRGRDWWWVVGLGLLAIAFYYLNVLMVAFLVPLQVLYARRGRRAFLLSSALVLIGVAAIGLVLDGGSGALLARLIPSGIEVGEVLLLLLGLLAMNSRFLGIERRIYRLLAVTGVIAVLSVPLLIYAAQSVQVNAALRAMVRATLRIMQSSLGMSSGSLAQFSDIDKAAALLKGIVFRGYLFGYFVMLAATWRIGSSFSARSMEERPSPLSRFILPELVLWPVLASWALVVISRFTDLGVVVYLAWNAGLIGAFLYALTGVGIVEHLLDRLRVARGLRLLLMLGVLFLLMVPGVGIVLAGLLTVLGISELWVRFGRV